MSVAKYKQIAKTIEARIESDEYPKGFKLPTHRVLADELNTTPATIAKAYQLLVDKKRVESFVGRGTFVCSPSRLSDVIQPADDETDFNFSILQPCLSQNLSPLRDAMMNAADHLSCHLMGYTEHSGHDKPCCAPFVSNVLLAFPPSKPNFLAHVTAAKRWLS